MGGLRIDAHQHFWQPARGDYGWLTPELKPLYRDFGPTDLAPLMAATRIDRSIVVQAAPTIAETEFLLDLAAKTPSVAGVVGWAPLDASDAARLVRGLAERPGLVGLRPMLQDLPDDAWMLRPELAPALLAMSQCGLAFDALVKPRHLAALLAFVDRYPELRVVIDHGAKPAIPKAGKHWIGFDGWREAIARLAERPQVFCKLSGLATEAMPGFAMSDLAPFAACLFDAFGPERVMWGSDWPVVTLATGYVEWHDAALGLVESLSVSERVQVFGGAAAAFYRLSQAP